MGGRAHEIHEKAIKAEVWKELSEGAPWRKKGTIVSDTRFFASLRESRAEDRQWHARYFGYLLAAMENDLLHGVRFEEYFKVGKVAPLAKDTAGAAKDVGMKSSAQNNESAMRKACGNLLSLAAMMYSSDHNQLLERIIVHICAPLEAWHSSQNKELRSAHASIDWSCHQLSCGLLDMCNNTAGALRDSVAFPRLGFTVLTDLRVAEEWVQRMPREKQIDLQDTEDDLAVKMGSLCLGVLGSFLSRLPCFFRGWPMGSVRFLDDSTSGNALALLLEDKRRFDALCASDNPAHKHFAERSCFQCVPAQQIVAMALEEGAVTARLKHAMRQKHSRLLATQSIEDGFHTCRDLETGSMNKTALPRAAFEALVESRIFDGRHKFSIPDFAGQPLKRDARLPDAVFVANSSALAVGEDKALDLREIIGYGQPSWYSPGAATLNACFCDLALFEDLEARKQLNLAGSAWLSCFLDGTNLLVRRKAKSEGEEACWYFAIGCVDGSASIVWPAREKPLVGTHSKAYQPSSDVTHVHWATVVRLCDWEAVSFVWRSPLWLLRNHHKTFGGVRAEIWAVVEHDAKPLVEVAAEAAFWTFGSVRLRPIAAHLGLDIELGVTLMDVLVSLIKDVMKTDGDSALWIARRRLDIQAGHRSSTFADMLDSNEALFYMSKEDEEAIRKDQKNAGEAEASAASLTAQWKAKALTASGCKGPGLTKAMQKKIL